MQMLYDGLFQNVINGLPIVKSLVSHLVASVLQTNVFQILTEPLDGSLYLEVSITFLMWGVFTFLAKPITRTNPTHLTNILCGMTCSLHLS